ncbi:type IV pilus secretin PilQ [Aquincola sp. J276]|uniref:type IV pilus secretin PilQ n=2 Tax=Aquincola TaxID=391952 RepID=UPI000614CA07|nr:type IV pilus secretin PilQ [Aquincola sp. J276]MCR5865610.1 type IV pilus secretin PilQ [Aquincola sp. J276]
MTKNQEKRTMTRWKAWGTAIVLAMGVPIAALAQGVIQSITSTQQAGSEVVRIEMSEPLAAVPAGFVVQAPPRIAIDLPGVSSALPRSIVELNQGNLRSVNVARGGDRTRLVLNLKQAATYRAQLEGKALLIVVDSGGPADATMAAAATPPGTAPAAQQAAAPVHFAPSQNTDPLSLRDIDFRRGQDGAGRVVVDLPNSQVGVDIRQQGQQLVVEFLRSTLPDRLRRRLDVADFGTPVGAITTVQTGDRVRMTIEPRGAWEHSAYQSDNQFVVEVRPMVIDPNKLVQGPGYSGEKLSLNFQNIEVRALLQVIADFTNFNVVTSDTVTGTVTLRLKDVPWDQALDIIMQAKGLGLRKNGNVLWIAPKDELSAKEQVELEARKKIADLEPVRTQSFQLNYTKAEEVAKGLTGQSTGSQPGGQGGGAAVATRILSPRGSVIFETRTNQLFVSDIPSKLEEVQAIIAKIDIPVRQVLIEARIVEADDTFGRALGIKLGGSDLRGVQGGIPGWSVGGGNYVTVGGGYNAVNGQTGQSPSTDVNQLNSDTGRYNNQFINLPANVTNLGGSQAATFALSLFSASANRFLNLELSALEADGKGKIVSSPRVVTADQIKAVIEQGEEIPYQVATSSGATSIQFKKASLKLEVVPQITPEGNVILTVDVAKDSRGAATTAGPAINTKHVNTQVLVENGGTVVLGGIFTQEERNDVNKVPLLGDIPVVGHLFKNTVRSSNKTELLVFITPKVVTDRVTAR